MKGYNKGTIYTGKNRMFSSSFKSAVWMTYGFAKKELYLDMHFLSEVKVYRVDDLTSMGEMLCLLVTLFLAIRKSISIRDSLFSVLFE